MNSELCPTSIITTTEITSIDCIKNHYSMNVNDEKWIIVCDVAA